MSSEVNLKAKPGSARELLTIAMPLVLSLGSLTLMLVVDRIFLAWYSDKALAASMPAGMLHWTLLSLFIGTANYLNSFVAQYEGAKQPERVATVLWQGVYFSLLAGLLVTGCAPLAGTIFRWTGHAPAVAAMEASYFSLLCLSSVPILLTCVFSSFYSGRGRTLVIMWVNLGTSLIKIGLDYLLIFPPIDLGIEGAGIATVVTEIASCAIFLFLIVQGPDAKNYGLWKAKGFDRALFARLIRYGVPNGCQLLIDGVCYTIFIFMIGLIGDALPPTAKNVSGFDRQTDVAIPNETSATEPRKPTGGKPVSGGREVSVARQSQESLDEIESKERRTSREGGTRILAATNLAFNLNALAFLPMLGFGTAISTLVGNRIGEGRPELGVRTTWIAFWISATYMSLFGLVFLFVPNLVLFPYTWGSDAAKFAEIRPIAILLLRFVAVYSLFDAMAIVFGAAIRGAGDTRFCMIYGLFCGVLLMLVPTYIGFRYFGGGLILAWSACTFNICVLGIGFFLRFQQGAWKSMRIIEKTAPDMA